MSGAEYSIEAMLSVLEDCFYERMHDDKGGLLNKYDLEDYDWTLCGYVEVKIDFRSHWQGKLLGDSDPVFMLRTTNLNPTVGDEYRFYIALYCEQKGVDAGTQERISNRTLAEHNINAPQRREPGWHPVWAPIYQGTSYRLRGPEKHDAEALYELFVTNFEESYPLLLEKSGNSMS